MVERSKPKSALIAFCVLAERLKTPGVGIMQALTPFLAEACRNFSGELFDASKFSDAVADRYGIRIPRLAVLGLVEQLARNGLLTPLSGHSVSTVYRYSQQDDTPLADSTHPVSEAEIEAVLQSFVTYCRKDDLLNSRNDASLQQSFLDRLLNVDSMRLLVRREASITAKKTPNTLVVKTPSSLSDPHDREELHIDFLVSQFLLDLRNNNLTAFEQVSNVAFANMAAEAISCFQEPSTDKKSLSELTVYLDSPLLLDMLGVNEEYTDYGLELLQAIKASGAKAAVFDHCIAEAEASINAKLTQLHSGINQISTNWGTSKKPALLSVLSGNVGDRAEQRLGIEVQHDPDVNLHLKAQTTVGDIESEITRRMQAWRNAEAKEYDRKSIWAMLSIRNHSVPCPRICDSQFLLLTRNTPLVGIANDSWVTWLKGATKHSATHVERWSPIAMSDKQFAGYLWVRTGGGNETISRARLLAHCSAAVRPRADVKARAYNLVLELCGTQEAEDVQALLENREAAGALMRVTKGDPEDFTKERLPFILEQVTLAAGEYAASAVREELEQRATELRSAYNEELARSRSEAASAQSALEEHARMAMLAELQHEENINAINSQNKALRETLASQAEAEAIRKNIILNDGLRAGVRVYRRLWGYAAFSFGMALWLTALLAIDSPVIAAVVAGIVGITGYAFMPDFLKKPMSMHAMAHLKSEVLKKTHP